MAQTKTDVLFNEMRLEFNPTKLAKCGEIQINDLCTKAYIFCAFCFDYDGDHGTKFFTTIEDFVDHIRWHRSDDFDSPILQNGIGSVGFEGLENDSLNEMSIAPHIQEAEFLTDWIAPPEELFASNTITNFIEMDPPAHESDLSGVKPQIEQQDIDKKTLVPKLTEADEDVSELTGEVFIELMDLYKKCPCVWHDHIASTTNSNIIDAVYQLLGAHFNKYAQKSKSVDYVRRILMEVRNCFLEEYEDLKQVPDADSLPWYFPYLSFILDYDSIELDKSIYTDFVCPICTLELTSQDDLWKHLLNIHLELNPKDAATDYLDDLHKPPGNKTSVCEYPAEIVDKFIDLYRSHTRLWNKTNKEYYSRLLRRKSYDLLLNVLREHNPKAALADVVSRINYLNDEYAHCKKDALCPENSSSVPANQGQIFMEKITLKKNRYRPPQLKVRPGNFKKKIRSAKCPICTKSFKDQSAWLSHMESVHTNEDYQSKDGFFYCTICGWQNKTKKILMGHLRNKHTNNFRRCTDCNLGFPLLSMLVEHRAKVHDDFNPFKCETCGDGFPSRSGLRTHAATHWSMEERSHLCIQCGNKFADKQSCRIHIRRHKLDRKELLCKFCKKELSTMAELRKHMCTHLNLLGHRCDKCEKDFPSQHLLKKHLNEVHNGTNLCSHIYRNKLKKQIATSKKCCQKQFQTNCDECGTRFIRKTSLRKHKRLKHNR